MGDGFGGWTVELGTTFRSCPAVVGDAVYIASLDGVLHAVDARSGARKWSYRTGGGVDSSPSVLDGVVYVGSGDGGVHAVRADDGDPVWVYRTGRQGLSSPAVAGGRVLIGGADHALLALDAATGRLVWDSQFEPELIPGVPEPGGPPRPLESSPVVAGDLVYIVAAWKLCALCVDDGTVAWVRQANAGPLTSAAVAHDTVYVLSTTDSALSAFDARRGNLRWRSVVGPVALQWGNPAVADGMAFVGGIVVDRTPDGDLRLGDGVLVALDAEDGTVRWHHRFETTIETSPAVADGTVLVASAGRSGSPARLTALDTASGTVAWARRLPPSDGKLVSSPSVAGAAVYLGLADGTLAAFPATAPSSPADQPDLAAIAARTVAGPVPGPVPDPDPTQREPPRPQRPAANDPAAAGSAGDKRGTRRSVGESQAARRPEPVTTAAAADDGPGSASRPRPRRAVILLAPLVPTLQMVALVALVASLVDGWPAIVAGVAVASVGAYAVATALFTIGVLLGHDGSARPLLASLAALGAAFLFATGPRINRTTAGRIKSWANASAYLKGAGLMVAHDLAVDHWMRLARAWSVRGTRDAVAFYAYVLAERSRCAYWHRRDGRPAHDYIVRSLALYGSIDAFDDPELASQAHYAAEFLHQIDHGPATLRTWP